MNGQDITQLGIGAVIAILILREVFKFLGRYLNRKRNGNGKDSISKELCDERTKNIHGRLDSIDENVKELLRRK